MIFPRGWYWAKWICFDANESFKSSWICWSFENIGLFRGLFDEFVEFQKIWCSSNEYHNKCVECVEYLMNVLNCMKCMLSLMLNRYIFDFVLKDDNECAQISTDGSTECGRKLANYAWIS
jgi:hypothetical protein